MLKLVETEPEKSFGLVTLFSNTTHTQPHTVYNTTQMLTISITRVFRSISLFY